MGMFKLDNPLANFVPPQSAPQAPAPEDQVYDASFNNTHVFPPGTTDVERREAIARFNRDAAKRNLIAQSLGMLGNVAGQLIQPSSAPGYTSNALAGVMGPQGVARFQAARQHETDQAQALAVQNAELQQRQQEQATQQAHWQAQLAQERARQQELDEWRKAQLGQRSSAQEALATYRAGMLDAKGQGLDESKRYHDIQAGLGVERNAQGWDRIAISRIGLAHTLARDAILTPGSPYYIPNATNDALVKQQADLAQKFMEDPLFDGRTIPTPSGQRMMIDYRPQGAPEDDAALLGDPTPSSSAVIPGATPPPELSGPLSGIPGAPPSSVPVTGSPQTPGPRRPPTAAEMKEHAGREKVVSDRSAAQRKTDLGNQRMETQDVRDQLAAARADLKEYRTDLEQFRARMDKKNADSTSTTGNGYTQSEEEKAEEKEIKQRIEDARNTVNTLHGQLYPSQERGFIPGAQPTAPPPAPAPSAHTQYPEGTMATTKDGKKVVRKGGTWQPL